MVRAEPRIIFAAIAVFVTLGGIAVSIHGLLYDEDSLIRYGVAAVVLGIMSFVLLLNPMGKRKGKSDG